MGYAVIAYVSAQEREKEALRTPVQKHHSLDIIKGLLRVTVFVAVEDGRKRCTARQSISLSLHLFRWCRLGML